MKKTKTAILSIAAVGMLATGCATASNPADLKSVHYSGGSLSAKKFINCLDPSKRSGYDPGDGYYAYPVRQISYVADKGDDAERGRIKVVSQDNAELYVPVQLTFQLDTECDTLRKFHEEIGARYTAYVEGDGKTSADMPDGWDTLLNTVIGKPLDQVLDRVAQKYPWRSVWNNPQVKAEMEKEVKDNIEALVNQQAGGDFFTDFTVLISKPDPVDQNLVSAIAAEQAGVAQANADKAKAEADAVTAKAKAEADIATAKAQTVLAEQQAKVKRAEIAGYGGIDNYLRHEAIAGGQNPFQPTYIWGGTAAP